MTNNYKVYIHTNNINNKKYVGLTSQKYSQRWRSEGKGYKNQPKFYRAIKKYGWDNFSHETIAENLSKEEAGLLEKELIQKYNTIEKGYNVEEGGFVTAHNKETIEKIRQAMIGKTHTQFTKDKISASKTDETQAVLCVETNIIYPSARKAYLATGADPGRISECCRGIALSAKGYTWRYVHPDKYNQYKEACNTRKDKSKRQVRCIETGHIYNTATEAAKDVGAETTNIVKACRGKIKTSMGYHWEYADE